MLRANLVKLLGRENIITECDQMLGTNLVVDRALTYLSDREQAELYVKKYL
ncbi:MAG TPA: hypothetical protein VMW83_04345 [Spirochaetia bacterium]|nr:hypothetical protein [Spirochaetia bacterium]